MYTHFKDELVIQLSTLGIATDLLNLIMDQVELVAYNYNITEKQTEIIPYEFGLPELAKKYLVTKSVEGLSKGTLSNYNRCLSHFFNFIKKKPEEINEEDITFFLYWYKRRDPEKEISDRSLDKILDTLKAFFKWAFNRRYISYNPTATLPPIKHARKIQDHLDDVELEMVRRACKTKKEIALIEFFFSTGGRVSEVANVKLSDINWDNRTVQVFGKGKKYRTAFLNVRTCFCLQDYIHNYRQGTSEYLFVSDRRPYNQIHKDGIEKIIRKIGERSKVDKHISCHCFRRTLATHLLEKNAAIQDIQKILGHEKIETTLRYANDKFKQVQETHKKLIS